MKHTLAAKCFGGVLLLMSVVEILFAQWIQERFDVTGTHSLLHFVTALGVLAIGFTNESASRTLLLAVGILNGLIARSGFMVQSDQLFGFMENNRSDAWMHLAISAVAVFLGKSKQESVASDERVAY